MTVASNPDRQSLPIIAGYTILETLYSGTRTAVYRAVQTPTQQPVVIKVLRREYPSFGEIVQFRNQYTIAKNLPIPGIVRPLSLEPLRSGYAMVMEDWGGVALGKYLQQQSLTLTEVLAIALQLADILHDLGQHRVIHKDIKPPNILIQPETKQVKLIDFSIASLLPKETQEIESANILEGTLAYIAPEQTGRMNRGIDYRTDFYALGVTLYQLLTGKLPFESDDPLELIHCHIAKVPFLVDRINPDVPGMVAAIVRKLMAKNAEDRYQSAMGLKHDLERCLQDWEITGAIADFELGQRDFSDRFLIPEKLYGRETEVKKLLDAFDRVANPPQPPLVGAVDGACGPSLGGVEMMLVAGFSGIGKTAVINEVHKPIVRQRGYFIKGKFDQFNRNIPLSAFVQALRDLMGQLLSESDRQMAGWRERILQALGENGQVLIEVIPELERILGKQPIATELSGTAAQNRFNLLFQKFIEVFTRAEHPLVIFLDDLQWADLASLQLLKLLMNDKGYLLLLGAYRDNEVSPVHPFIMTVDELQKAQTIVNIITLAPLAFEDTNHLIADTLNCSRDLAQPLTELVDRKTKGNPFFTTQFLKALHDDCYIRFDRDRHSQGEYRVGGASQHENRRYWECDIAQINTLALTDDVVEFMALQLQKLSAETQQVLKLAACIGNQFDLNTLAIVSEQSLIDAATALWKALQEGFILPTSQVYKFFQEGQQAEANTSANPSYRFLHDRVQQAAYSLIPETERAIAHYQIGQLLLKQLSPIEQQDRIFELVNQLNYGISLLGDRTEQQHLAQLNLLAAQKARAATAYQAAYTYAQIAIDLIGEDGWHSHYQETLALYELAAEVACLSGKYEQMEQWIETVLAHTSIPREQATVYQIRIQAFVAQNNFTAAISTGRNALKLFDIHLPEQPTPDYIQQEFQSVFASIGDRPIESLFDLPKMQDADRIAILNIAMSFTPVCYLSNSPLFPSIAILQVKRSIEFGNAPASCISYSAFSILLIMLAQAIDLADRFGQLAYRLAQEPEAKNFRSSALAPLGVFVHHRKSHLQETLSIFQIGYQVGIETGALEDAGYHVQNICSYSFWCGQPLSELETQIRAYHQQLLDLNQLTTASYCAIYWEAVLMLLDRPESSALAGEHDTLVERKKATNDVFWVYKYYLYRCGSNFILGHITEAGRAVAKARNYLSVGAATLDEVSLYFYDSLICLATISGDSSQQHLQLQQVQENQAQLHLWAHHGPMNYLHKWQLVEAEHLRATGNKIEAIDLYDRAIAGAKENGYIQEEALANELAAKFYLNWGKEKVAAGYMQEAYYCYTRWGAKAKTDDLEQRYPSLLRPIIENRQGFNSIETLATLSEAIPKGIAAPSFSIHASTQASRSSSSSSINTTLDFAAVLRASQSLSSTIQLDDLLHQLTGIILQNSGADRCVLILPNSEGEWEVRAIATLKDTQLCHAPLHNNRDVPTKLIYYVKNTKQGAIFDDCETDLPVLDDEYFSQHRPKSVLCLPILNQGNSIGILYLQNQLTCGVFTSDRVLILNFLCTQAAISLENARLYQQSQTTLQELQQSQQVIGEIIDTIPQVVFWKDRNSTYLGCNQKFAIQAGLVSPKDIIGKTDYELPWSKEESDSYRDYDRKVMESNQPELHIIETQQQQDGSTIWLDTSKIPLCNEAGEVYGILGSYDDISDRKRAEKALLESETKFRRLVEDANDVIWSSHLDTTLTYLSPQFGEIFGWAPEEWIGKSFVPLVHPEDLPSVFDFIDRVVESGEKRAGHEFRNIHKDGSFRWLTSNISPIKDESGRVIGLQGILRDISDRKQAEAALVESEAYHRNLFDQSSIGLALCSMTGQLLYANTAYANIIGRTSEETLQLSYWEITPAQYADAEQLQLQSLQATGRYGPYEKEYIHKNGHRVPVRLSGVIVERHGEQFIWSSVEDISDRKAAESLIQHKNQALEQALIQVQQSQARVVQSEKMSALGNLVAGVAHEINNPIGFLKGSINNAKEYVQDLLDYVVLYQQHHPNPATPVQDKAEEIDLAFLSEDLLKMLDSMEGASDRISRISTSLRTFSRADTEYKVSANLHEGLDSTLLILKYRLKANDRRPAIQVIQDYGDLPSIYCFPGQLNQVFMNILANAIDMFDEMAQNQSFAELKAHPQQITIRTIADANQVQIQISDNGQGMMEEVKAQIFDHLFTTKSVGKGTGLGLAIARQIVEEKHGGCLEVQSEFGKGTEFCIRLAIGIT